MNKEKLLTELAKAEGNREEILGNLKEKEHFYLAIYMRIGILAVFLLQIYSLYLNLKVAKYRYDYISVIDYATSPAFLPIILIYTIFFLAFAFLFAYSSIKIDLEENYIRLNLIRKIYFEDIILVEVKNTGKVTITDKEGKVSTIRYDVNKVGKFLLILKEKVKDRFTTEKGINKNHIRNIFIILIISILIKIFSSLTGDIINNFSKEYMYGADFSKYGTVKEEFSDGSYVEFNYKHGKKNGLAKYYNSAGTIINEIEYKNNKILKEKEYTEEGILTAEKIYNKDNSSQEKYYYPNGKLKEELTIEGDIYNRKLYNGDGLILLKETTKDLMIPQGEKIIYYPNGEVFIKAEFNEKGKVIPPVKVYDDTGNLRIEDEYDHKREHSTQKIYDKNGKLIKVKEEDFPYWQKVYSIKVKILNYFESDELYRTELKLIDKLLEENR